ncbi:MAG: MaoC/PaaZ C-terminal domain-containing protein [Nitrospinota bacterium]
MAGRATFGGLQVGDTYELCEGPLSRTDFVRYAGASGDFNPNHHDEVFARASGFPSVFAMGMVQGGLLARMLTDWLGAGSLRHFRVRFTAQLWPGDTVVCRGRVVEKREEGGLGLVEIEANALNQKGETLIKGSATAALALAG